MSSEPHKKIATEPVWCVQHRDGWCRTASQPAGEPRYRDHVKTACDHWVVCCWGFERRQPTCRACGGTDAE